MTEDTPSFSVEIEFESILNAISKQIYETPLAYVRENTQNAIDAVRIQAIREGVTPDDPRFRIDIEALPGECTIEDNGIGMTPEELRDYFWTMGASGKRTDEAKQAGCVGKFGIGGFANFGVCSTLEVTSQVQGQSIGMRTVLSEKQIRNCGKQLPQVMHSESDQAAPRGTVVRGTLREECDVSEIESYIREFVRFTQEKVYFKGKLVSGEPFLGAGPSENLEAVTDEDTTWSEDDLQVTGRFYEDQGGVLVAFLSGMIVDGNAVQMIGRLRFENGPINLYKRGFKLCATKIGTQIGVSGRIDCDRFSPTAGRDSLNADSAAFVGQIVSMLERVAIDLVLQTPKRIADHTRIFPHILRNRLTSRLGNVGVRLADGADCVLNELREKAEAGVGVYHGTEQKQALSSIMQARGNIVVLVPSDRHKRKAVIAYLEAECAAKRFEGIVECQRIYTDIDRFEQIFMSELEMCISGAYEVPNIIITPGKLTEDIPVYIADKEASSTCELYLDVRHPEISKLRQLGMGSLLYSMIANFCREYLGPTLRKRSPKFFGSGAINLDVLARKRSELWILLKDDIEVVKHHRHRAIVRSGDVEVVRVGDEPSEEDSGPKRKPKLLHVVGDGEFEEITGYYIRLPEGSTIAYGDIIKECDNRAVVWAGNKMLFVASDNVSSAFQFEVRVDHLIVLTGKSGEPSVEGAEELPKPIQEMHDGLYFPIPSILEPILVPQGDDEIRIEVRCDWIDMASGRAWRVRDEST